MRGARKLREPEQHGRSSGRRRRYSRGRLDRVGQLDQLQHRLRSHAASARDRELHEQHDRRKRTGAQRGVAGNDHWRLRQRLRSRSLSVGGRAMERLLPGAALALLVASSAAAQSPVDFAPDVTAKLGSSPSLVVNDHDLAHDNAVGGVTGPLIPAGTLPANVQIEGYHPLANGHTLLALDITTVLPGLPPGSPAEPRDVVEYDPAAAIFSTYFDGSAA